MSDEHGTTAWATWLLPLFLLTFPPLARAQWICATNDGAITLTGYTGPGGAITIPVTIDGLPVTEIGFQAFINCSSLSSVTIPAGVTTIGQNAFYGCSSLTNISIPEGVAGIMDGAFDSCTSLPSVTIPNSVATVGWEAFAGCSSLTSVTIPQSAASVGTDAFYGCDSLSAITVDPRNPSYTSADGVWFDKAKTTLIQYPDRKAGSDYAIPGGVAIIANDAFLNCPNLANVTIPGSVVSIGASAFEGCTSLSSVAIPNSVTNLGDWAFYDCTSLTNVAIGTGVTRIGSMEFTTCSSLSGVILWGGVTNVGEMAFAFDSSLGSVCFAGNAPAVDPSAFSGGDDTTVCYLPWTSGWRATLGGCPTRIWEATLYPGILAPPLTQTAEMGSAAFFSVEVTNMPPEGPCYQWYFDATNALSGATNSFLGLTNLQSAQAGAYTVVVSNPYGAVTSAPAALSVIAPVDRKIVPALNLTADLGNLVQLDYANGLGPGFQWLSLSNVTIQSTPQLCPDLSDSVPAQRFYRASQTAQAGQRPILDMRLATEIPLAGEIGGSVRIDYINQLGPTDAWVTLDTVVLTNSPQLYLDVTMFRQPRRLYRLVAVP
jgi:hypothetical protein